MDTDDIATMLAGAVFLSLAALFLTLIYGWGSSDGRISVRETFRTCIVQGAPLVNCLDANKLIVPTELRRHND